MHLAFTTFAIMVGPYGSPRVRGFEDRTPGVFAAAEAMDGFIDRAREIGGDHGLTNFERDWGKWGAFAVPWFYDGGSETTTDTRASTLSIWRDVAAVRKFAYTGLHARALALRNDWFRTPAWPTYCMWAVEPDAPVTWLDAVKRLEHLHAHGPTPFAFTFGRTFPLLPDIEALVGRTTRPIDRDAVIAAIRPEIALYARARLDEPGDVSLRELSVDSMGVITLLMALESRFALDFDTLGDEGVPRTLSQLVCLVQSAGRECRP